MHRLSPGRGSGTGYHMGDQVRGSLRCGIATRLMSAWGSLASKAAEAVLPCTSAALPKADVNSPPWLPPLSPRSRHKHRSKSEEPRRSIAKRKTAFEAVLSEIRIRRFDHPPQRNRRDRRRLLTMCLRHDVGKLEQLAPGVRPARRLGDPAWSHLSCKTMAG